MEFLPSLLLAAWLLPLLSFVVIVFFGPRLGKAGVLAGFVATGAILGSLVLSLAALATWIGVQGVGPGHAADHSSQTHAAAQGGEQHAPAEAGHDDLSKADAPSDTPASGPQEQKRYIAGDWYYFSPPGLFTISIGYYIDALTIGMFAMVSLIATCIHFYTMGYMHEELHDVTDHEVTLDDGKHLHRPGRYHRFYQYLSLFCFSMLGLVLAGNIAMVFVFWELVGICSYFLIGFYIERKTACNAANKAFIVNRVGDFGMIIGLMALWSSLGTFSFGDVADEQGHIQPGLFSLVRPASNGHQLVVPDGMVAESARDEVATIVAEHRDDPRAIKSQIQSSIDHDWRDNKERDYGYGLLIVAGVGIFCGCVGKSAQFPLHVWLPDAMEGPTPVSALVHSATMVAAGVYLVGRFFPMFTPEVLLVIAIVGAITLFMAATIAITATDIKRVLAYSTISQLGYMMLALGIGGWLAGLFHLITHAFFKSLLFLCSGSVIHACHTNEMTMMGGLRKKLPITAYTMLAGCLAIAGAPFMSGFYSKDYIIAHSMHFGAKNPSYGVFFYTATIGAAITAFYMFRLWFMTFAGKPRDEHVYDHAHESPKVMWAPLVILAVFAVGVGWEAPFAGISVENLLEQARPLGTEHGAGTGRFLTVTHPSEHESHTLFGGQATLVATLAALAGFGLATLMYGVRRISADDARRQFGPIYRFLWNKWWFDELYRAIFVRPVMFLSRIVADVDRKLIDWLLDASARWTRNVSWFNDAVIDRSFVDGLANMTANWVYACGLWIRRLQTGNLRQYILLIVVGTVALFVVISFWGNAAAG